jgi:hypothetical protein
MLLAVSALVDNEENTEIPNNSLHLELEDIYNSRVNKSHL